MDTTILNELKNNTGTPCVSLIMPTHAISSEHLIEDIEMKKMLNMAKDLVYAKCGKKNGGEEILKKLKELSINMNYEPNSKGIGFFVSPSISRLVSFPFDVKEKVIVGNNFEVRDMVYLAETMISYYVLLINDNEIKLFEGNGENLRMVKNKDFPAHFVDDYEYTHASIGSSYGYALKSVEKDKSIIKEKRFSMFIKQSDQKLFKYLSENTPLIISGNTKELSTFKKISTNYKNVVGKISGNYSHENIQKLGELSFSKIKEYLVKEEDSALKRFENAKAKRLAVSGIENVWEAANEGKGMILLVEKDYAIAGYIAEGSSNLLLDPPDVPYDIISDAADDVIEIVLAKKGKVIIVGNEKLKDSGGIALILRYW